MDIYNKEKLQQRLRTSWLGKENVYMDIVNSTNDYAKKKAMNGAGHGLLVVADNQTSGKGSHGRLWVSPPQTGIWMSFVLRADIPIYQAGEITLMMSYCIAKVLREIYQIPVMIKWPNDIVLNGKKIAGILTEGGIDKENNQYLVTGIGINVNMEELPNELRYTASSLFLECGHKFSRAELLADILKQIEEEYEKYRKVNSLKDIYEQYNNILVHKQMEVKIIKGQQEITAIAIGINEHGELSIRKSDGRIENICAGEISVRGIHNYV